MSAARRDLFVLCPDIQWDATLHAILERPDALKIRPVTFEVRRVPGRTDGWVRSQGVAFLRPLRPTYDHALMVFDHEGCHDPRAAGELEPALDASLGVDWSDRGAAIVVEPELEEWLVGAHRWLPNLIGTAGPSVREWWVAQGHWGDDCPKPERPKEALQDLLDARGVPRSSATYRKIAAGASLSVDRCQSRSYQRFVAALRRWFPPAGGSSP